MGRRKQAVCSHGHRMIEGNLYIRPDGQRQCLACKRRLNLGDKVYAGNGSKAEVVEVGGGVFDSRGQGGAGIASFSPAGPAVDRRESRSSDHCDVEPDDERVGIAPICGFQAYNENDGETYRCRLPVHGPKIKHGVWEKI